MAKLVFLLIILASCSIFSSTAQQPCSTYSFSNNEQFSSCTDLPVLNCSLHWNYHQSSNRVDVAFRHAGATDHRWIAWAINPTSGGMIGSQAIIAFPRTDGTLAAYTSPITSYGTQLEQGNLSFPVYDVSATYQSEEMIIFASIGLVGNSTTVNHLWQVGPLSENTPLMHSVDPSSPNVRSMGSLDFLSGRIIATRSTSRLKYVHGALNALSWGFLMPAGAIIARYLKVFHSANPLWFYLHVGCQVLASVLGVFGGGVTGLVLGARSRGIAHGTHRNIAIALSCLAATQVCVGIFRPQKDGKRRPYFNWFHRLMGLSTMVLGIVNIFQGFQLLQEPHWKLAYIATVGAMALLIVILEPYTWWLTMRRQRSSDDIEKTMSAGQDASAEEKMSTSHGVQ